MTRQQVRRRPRQHPPRNQPRRRGLKAFFLRRILFALPFLIVAGAGYLGYLDFRIRNEFEGKKWALPARIYAAPQELFVGAPCSPDLFDALLRDLKYRGDPKLSSQASYRRQGSLFIVKTRSFRFPDRQELARTIEVGFEADRVSSISDSERSQALSLVRMEPVQIGSIYPTRKEDRILIRLDQAPRTLLEALYAVEDRHFHEHAGISLRGIARAMWMNLRSGAIVQGGSTLTQQLVKNLFLSSERSWWRKVNEAVMALILEARYSKEQILEAYLNEVYLGQDGARAIHGFALASQYYFARSLSELGLQHVALLVGLVRGPSYYDPFQFPDRALQRRDRVLDAMAEEGYASQIEIDAAKRKPLDVLSDPHQPISQHPAFLELVRRQLAQDYAEDDLSSEGLRIFTTLDVAAQKALESAVADGSRLLDRQSRVSDLETAGVVVKRESGEVAALVGSRRPLASGFNRALDAERQIGSLYKPVVYLSALSDSKKYTIATPISDRAIQVKVSGGRTWAPSNYDRQEHGTVLLSTALAQSYNLATVRLGLGIGVQRTLDMLGRLGVRKTIPPFPSVLLGAVNLTPLEVAQVYQTLGSDGFTIPLAAIRGVTSSDGKPLKRNAIRPRRETDSAAVFVLNRVLQDAVAHGTGRGVYSYLPREFDVVGKTGTTNDLKDSWFAGFTGDYLGVVWVGRDDGKSVRLSGAQGALKIWGLTMKQVAREPVSLVRPQTVEEAWIDRGTGLRSDKHCANAVLRPFIKGSVPPQGRPCAAQSVDSDSLF